MKGGVVLSTRLPVWVVRALTLLTDNVSEYIRDAVVEKVLRDIRDPSLLEQARMYYHDKLLSLDKEKIVMMQKLNVLTSQIQQVKEVVDNFDEIVEEVEKQLKKLDDIVKEAFADIHELTPENIEARVEAISSKYGYPRELILQKVSELIKEGDLNA